MANTIDKAAMGLSGACFLIGIVVLGFIEVVDGKSFSPLPVKNEAGKVVATALIDPAFRTGFVVLGLLVLGVYAAYKLVAPGPEVQEAATGETTAD